MTHEKLVAGTESPTRYTKIIRNPGAGTKYNRTYQEAEYVSRYTKTVAGGKDYVPPAPPGPDTEPLTLVSPPTLTGDAVVGATITGTKAVYSGGVPPVEVQSQFQKSDNGTSGWSGVDQWGSDSGGTHYIGPDDVGKYFRVAGRAIDSSEDSVSKAETLMSFSELLGPVAEPEPDFEPPIVATKAQMSELNVYEIGQTIEAFAATWRNGNPENQTYRSRWQYKETSDDSWVNTSWTTHVNEQVKFTTVIDEPGIYRFNTQVRDSTVDPIAQVNSFSQSKTVDFPEPMVVVPPTLSGTPRVGSTLTCSEPVVTGGIAPYSFSYMWLDSETKSPANDTVLLEFDEGKMVSCYVTVTDAIGTIEHTESNKVGPIEPAPTIGHISLTVDDVSVVWGEAVHVPVNTPVHVVATISGNANPTYKWEARNEYPLMVGSQAATTTLTFPEEGGPTVTLTVTDSTASDSPISYAMNFYVASQTEWDILHPEDNQN